MKLDNFLILCTVVLSVVAVDSFESFCVWSTGAVLAAALIHFND